ncbi:MAG: acyltransferase [Clostridiales bacterium]|nr:acyltransferase [Clostridiales bacterium]
MNDANTGRKTNKKFMVLSAIGICMVVDLHCDNAIGLMTAFLPYESFFLPMFIFISGYFNKVDNRTDLFAYLKKKTKRLLVPYFLIAFATIFLEWAINSIKFGVAQPFTMENICVPIINIFTVGYPVLLSSPMWFVTALFLVQLVYALIKKPLYKKWNSIVAFVVFCLLNIGVVWFSKSFGTDDNFIFALQPLKCLFFLPFLELGILYREKLEPKMDKIRAEWKLILLILLPLLNVIRMMILPAAADIRFESMYNLAGFTSPYWMTPIISSVIGILFWVTVVDLIGSAFYSNRIVNALSENTFFIMGVHLVFINLVNCVLLAIHDHLTSIPGFDVDSFRNLTYYIWEKYPAFKLVYFIVGLGGTLLIKCLFDTGRQARHPKM